MALAGEEMRERELAHLRGGGLDQLLVAVAERGAPQPRHAFDVTFAFGVVDEDALASFQDERAGFAQRRELGVGMEEGLDVADREIAERRHGLAFVGAGKLPGKCQDIAANTVFLPLKGGGRSEGAKRPTIGWGSSLALAHKIIPPPGSLREPTSPFQGEEGRVCCAKLVSLLKRINYPWVRRGRGRGSGTTVAVPSLLTPASAPTPSCAGSRTSQWQMRYPLTRSARSTWMWFS